MDKIALLLITIIVISCSSDDDNEQIIDLGKVFEGSVELTSPLEVEEFGAHDYNTIKGSVTINDLVNQEHITNINALNSIKTIDGKLSIVDNPYLTNILGLSNLTSAYSIDIINNELLINLQGLNNITAIVGIINIENNKSLASFNGLNNLTEIRDLNIKNNESLTNFNGLQNLKTLYNFTIWNNELLTSLSGLNSIKKISYYVGIHSNTNLADYCIFRELETSPAYFWAYNNLFNPTIEMIQNGNCSI